MTESNDRYAEGKEREHRQQEQDTHNLIICMISGVPEICNKERRYSYPRWGGPQCYLYTVFHQNQ
jgi:hypothetical protein